jgi:hypothetical protein
MVVFGRVPTHRDLHLASEGAQDANCSLISKLYAQFSIIFAR